MITREELLDRLHGIKNLPTFPTVVVKLSDLLQNSETSTEQISEVVKLDPAIANGVLHLANTVAFNRSSPISSIDDAIVRIGFRNISNIVFSLSIIRILPKTSKLMNYDQFWNHSLSVAYGSQIIERHSSKIFRTFDNLYISGLLHDIGILILDQFFADVYAEILLTAKTAEKSLHLIENELLGVNHSEIGAYVLQYWRLSEDIIASVKNIYSPHLATSEANKPTQILHLANYACENEGIGNGIKSFPINFSNSAWFDIGLNIDDIPLIIKEVNAETAKAKALFSVAKN